MILGRKTRVSPVTLMPNQFEEFFEDMFSNAMAYSGEAAVRDRQFTHYVLGRTSKRRERAWQETSRDLVDYVQAKASFVFAEKTGFGIVRLTNTYAAIRWDKEIFWKEIDSAECSLVIEEAKNNGRFADVTVLPIPKSDFVRQSDDDFESCEVHEVVFGHFYIDRCLSRVKELISDPSFIPHRAHNGEYVWFEDQKLGDQLSQLSDEDLERLRQASQSKSNYFVRGGVGYQITGLFSAQLSILLDSRQQFVFEVPTKYRNELIEFAKSNHAYLATLASEDNVSVPVSLDNLIRAANGESEL